MNHAQPAGFQKNIPALKLVEKIPDQLLESILSKLNEVYEWSETRASRYRVHAATQSEELIRSPLHGDFLNEIDFGEQHGRFTAELADLELLLRRHYRSIYSAICRCLFVNLPAG